MSAWSVDALAKFGGNSLVVRLHGPLKDFLLRCGSELEYVVYATGVKRLCESHRHNMHMAAPG